MDLPARTIRAACQCKVRPERVRAVDKGGPFGDRTDETARVEDVVIEGEIVRRDAHDAGTSLPFPVLAASVTSFDEHRRFVERPFPVGLKDPLELSPRADTRHSEIDCVDHSAPFGWTGIPQQYED